MKILHLRERIPWFGGHTGYEQLTGQVRSLQAVRTVTPRQGLLARYSGSAYARLHGRYGRGATSLSELEFRVQRRWQRPDASHVLYLENHFELLESWTDTRRDLVGTIHLPPAVWKPEQRRLLSRLGSALVLYRRDIPFFQQHLGRNRVQFIHHGADVEFFRPSPARISAPPRILYSGVYLRNEAMLARMVERLAAKHADLRFDLLVPVHHRRSPALAPLLRHPAVTWHAGLADGQLRDLYQQSYLMLLPLNDSGANTAVVEALASGLPLVTTDVGGIRDYAGGEIYPLVPNDDDDAMAALVEHYLSNPLWRHETGRRCREFAEQNMAWPLIARKHLEFYQSCCA